jgi:hypothetical protein
MCSGWSTSGHFRICGDELPCTWHPECIGPVCFALRFVGLLTLRHAGRSHVRVLLLSFMCRVWACQSHGSNDQNDFCSFMHATGWSDLVAFSPYGPHNSVGGSWNRCCTQRLCSEGTPACTAGSIMNSIGTSRPTGLCCDSGCSLAEGCVYHGNNGWVSDPTKGWRDTQFHPVCVRAI